MGITFHLAETREKASREAIPWDEEDVKLSNLQGHCGVKGERSAMAARAGLPLTSTTMVSPATATSVVPPKLPSVAARTEVVASFVVLSRLTVLLAGTAPALPVTI